MLDIGTLADPDSADPVETGPSALDRAHAVTQRQIDVLSELSEMGLEIARGVKQRALEPAEDSPKAQADWCQVFARVARAVRVTLALQSKLLKELVNIEDARAGRAKLRQADTARERHSAERLRVFERHDQVDTLIGRAIRAEYSDRERVERLADAARERLMEEDDEDLLDRPIGELVERICKDLGLTPDWAAWAAEPWAIEEAATGDPSSPFVRLAAEPPPDREPPAQFTPQAASP